MRPNRKVPCGSAGQQNTFQFGTHFFCVVDGSANRGESLKSGNDHIVVSAGSAGFAITSAKEKTCKSVLPRKNKVKYQRAYY